MTTEEENTIKRDALLSAIDKGYIEFYAFEQDSRFPINLSTNQPRGEVKRKRYLVIEETVDKKTTISELMKILPSQIEHDCSKEGGPFYLSVGHEIEGSSIVSEVYYWCAAGYPPREMQAYAMRDLVKGTMYRTVSGELADALQQMIKLLKEEGHLLEEFSKEGHGE